MSTPSQTGATSPPPLSSTGDPLAPGSGISYKLQQQENTSFQAWRDPIFDPFYYGYAWSLNPDKPALSTAGRKALIKQINALGPAACSGQAPIEPIDWGGGDPSTSFRNAATQGDSYFSTGQGDTQVVDISQAGAVVPQGGYTGAPPPGTTPVFANLLLLPPNLKRTVTPTPGSVSPVGIQEWPNAPYWTVTFEPPQNAPKTWPLSPTMQYVLTPIETTTIFGSPVTEWFYVPTATATVPA